MTWIEAIATLFGIACVWLTVRQHIWCWPTGLVQVFLYIFVFWEAKLYSDMVLHVIYVFLNVYGWWLWSGKRHQSSNIQVSQLGKMILSWLILTIAGTMAWGFGMSRYTDASVPYADAFTTVASLVAQWLMAKKKLESWLFWIAVDVAAIIIYWYKELYITSGLYTVFLVLAIMGWFEWRKAIQPSLSKPQDSVS